MNKNILLILGGGAVLYYLYSKQTAPAAAATGAAAATPPAQPLTAAPQTPSVSPAQQAKITAAINSSGVSTTFIFGQQTPDTWNWYAMQAFPGWTAPAPETLYPGVPNVHSMTYTFADWFGRIQQYLPTTGLSGLGGTAYNPVSQWRGPGGWYA